MKLIEEMSHAMQSLKLSLHTIIITSNSQAIDLFIAAAAVIGLL
jgi:hypothetical protein